MSPERLLNHFEQICEAPDAVPQLRRFILDLAVRGKLVEQDPADEPAKELFKQVEEKRACAARLGKIRKQKPLRPLDTTGFPFKLPDSWQWVRLAEVSTTITKGSTPTSYGHSYVAQGVNFIKVEAIRDGKLSPDTVTSHISEETHEFLKRSQLEAGDFLFSIAGSIGTCTVVTEPILPANTNQALAIIRGYNTTFMPAFLQYAASSSLVESALAKARGGAMNNISLEDVSNFTLPLPPLAEQHRIVAKVDELMALCDKLEATQAKREKRRDRLVAATLHGLNNGDASPAPGTPPTFKDSSRFYLNHHPRLTTRPEHIHQLRQTILNLAVRGKLVPQDPHDEPVAELLRRIDNEKKRLAAGDTRKRYNQVSEFRDVSLAPRIPESWKLVRIIDIALLKSGIAIEKGDETATGEIPYVKVADLNLEANRYGIVTSSRFITNRYRDSIIPSGSLIFPKRGGAIATNRKRLSIVDIVCDSNLMAMKPFLKDMLAYLQLWFSGFDLWKLNSGTSVPQINNKDIYPLLVPLPPLDEQLRIVARVDELLALCDELEAGIATTTATRFKLLEATLQDALAF